MEDEQPPTSSAIRGEDIPDWWPYAAEFPHWHVWRGVCGLVYARRPRTSPPLVVRADNPADLGAQVRRAEGQDRLTAPRQSRRGPKPPD
jgi:hypothetical protein